AVKNMKFPNKLHGSVWHSTSVERYTMIKADGQITANPALPDSERWGTGLGEDYYPFIRSLGGISVFDFRSFHVKQYNRKYGDSYWSTLVPCRSGWEQAVWIELDILQLGDNFLSGKTVRQLWQDTNSVRKFIAGIEGAVLGS